MIKNDKTPIKDNKEIMDEERNFCLCDGKFTFDSPEVKSLRTVVKDAKLLVQYIDELYYCETNKAIAYVVYELYINDIIHFVADTTSKKLIDLLTPFPKWRQWKIDSIRYHIRIMIDKKAIELHDAVVKKKVSGNISQEKSGSKYFVAKLDGSPSLSEIRTQVNQRIDNVDFDLVEITDPLLTITGTKNSVQVTETAVMVKRMELKRYGERKMRKLLNIQKMKTLKELKLLKRQKRKTYFGSMYRKMILSEVSSEEVDAISAQIPVRKMLIDRTAMSNDDTLMNIMQQGGNVRIVTNGPVAFVDPKTGRRIKYHIQQKH